MAFSQKNWENRLVEFAGRRALKNVATGETTIYDVTRNEGVVSQEGDAFSPANMNGLEQRIADAFDEMGGFIPVIDSETGKITGYKTAIGGADTVFPFRPMQILLPISLQGSGIDGGKITFSLSDVEKIFICNNASSGNIELSVDNPLSTDNLTFVTLTDAQKKGTLIFSQNVTNANMQKSVLLFCKPGGTIDISVAMAGVDNAILSINNSGVSAISNTVLTQNEVQILSKQNGNTSWNYTGTITLKNE